MSTDVSVRVGQTVVQPSDRVRDLGVILDSSLSMRQHIAKVASTCLFHLRKLGKIGKVLDRDSRNRLVCAFILTRTDYSNAVFAGLSDSTLAPLQRVFHAAARFVDDLRPRDHVTESLMSLHWLPVRERITHKLCNLMHGDLTGRCHLRSAQDCLFDIPWSRTAFGSRAFSTTEPQTWNQLPTDIRNIATYTTFKHNLKTFLFNIAYGN